jgi:rod shape-determining protein MreC
MPVVTGAGLVGKVVAVSQERATVLLLTDPSFNIGIRLSGSGDVGVARGNGSRQPLPVDLVDVGTKVTGHEVVVTSGLQGSVFPADIPVGRVRSAKVQPGSLQQEISIDPVVDLSRLDFIKVLLWQP